MTESFSIRRRKKAREGERESNNNTIDIIKVGKGIVLLLVISSDLNLHASARTEERVVLMWYTGSRVTLAASYTVPLMTTAASENDPQ